MARADTLVLLTHCQFEKGGYQNRFKYNGDWFSMSVNRGLDPIWKKKYFNPYDDWARIKKRIGNPVLEKFDICISHDLVVTNQMIIWKLQRMLRINTTVITDWATQETGTDRLLEICQRLKATKYISGPSGVKYLDVDKFKQANINVEFHYPSKKIPIIDAI